jgi:hypothetical protein
MLNTLKIKMGNVKTLQSLEDNYERKAVRYASGVDIIHSLNIKTKDDAWITLCKARYPKQHQVPKQYRKVVHSTDKAAFKFARKLNYVLAKDKPEINEEYWKLD